MDEIVELVGIVEGINYDGIINELEVLKLHDWVKRNQSLRYHGKYTDVITKLEEILEDNYISDVEKDFLISFSKGNLNRSKNINDSLNILNGIVEGIVCDNIINDQEVYCLHDWLQENSHLQGIKVYENIYGIIKEILQDNIITKEEQKMLLELLSNSILDSKSNLKIEYLKKMVLNHKNVGMDLIELIDSESTIQKIHESAQGQLSRILNSYRGSVAIDNELIFISLVLIGIKAYDGTFYSNVEHIYTYLYDQFSSQRIEGQIRTIISRFKTDKSMDQTRIINTVLMNAIVPQYFLPDFFEFIYDIYKINFDFVLDKNIYNDFKFVYEGISNSLNTDNDEIHFNNTKKVYKLIRSTKQLILSEKDFESIIQLSISVIKLIDKIYWEEKNIDIVNPYLKEGYQNWIKRYYNNRIQKRETGQNKNTLRSRWKPSFELHGKEVYLIPPIHRIKSIYDYRSIKIIIENEKEIIYENGSPYIQEIFGGYQIKSEEILIYNPLSQINYKIYADGEIFYESHKELFRDVIVFNQNGKEISNHADYEGTAIFCFKCRNTNIDIYYKDAYFQLGSKTVDMNTVLMFDRIVFNFSTIMNPGIVGNTYDNVYIKNSQIEMPVYSEVNYLVFESEYPASSLCIHINQSKIQINDYLCNVIQQGDHLKYVLKLPKLKSGIYKIKIVQSNTKQVIKNNDFTIAIDKDFSYTITKLDDENYIVDLNTSFAEENISKQLYIREFSKFNLSFFYDNTRLKYQFPLEIPMYQLDDTSWCPLSDCLWIDDVKHDSKIYFYGIDCIENEIRLVNGNSLLETIPIKKGGEYCKLPIGFIKTYKINYESINLIWLNSAKQISGICCLNVCMLNKEYLNIEYNPVLQLLNVYVSYEGKGNVGIRVLKDDETTHFCKDKITNNQNIVIENIMPFNRYSIVFFEKTAGFTLNKERIMTKIDKEFYSYNGLIGKSFKIEYALFEKYVKSSFVRKTHAFKYTYVHFDRVESDYVFIGNLYIKSKKDIKTYLDNVNPVEIEITGDINRQLCEIAITKDRDGLLLDFMNHTVYNDLDKPNATDIFSYTIDLKERD